MAPGFAQIGADRSRESATGRPVPQHREASTAGGHMAAQDARSDGADASLALKNEGNAALARGRYAEAISCYSRALEADPSSPVLYSNRAMAHIKAESYGLAIADAEASIRLDASYIKAYYRRGSANFALGKYKLALRDFPDRWPELVPRVMAALRALQDTLTERADTPDVSPSDFAERLLGLTSYVIYPLNARGIRFHYTVGYTVTVGISCPIFTILQYVTFVG